jgi:hypothetical protein
LNELAGKGLQKIDLNLYIQFINSDIKPSIMDTIATNKTMKTSSWATSLSPHIDSKNPTNAPSPVSEDIMSLISFIIQFTQKSDSEKQRYTLTAGIALS